MKKIIGWFWLILTPCLALGQTYGPMLFLDICRFYEVRTGDPYIEIQLAVASQSIQFRREADSLFQAQVYTSLLLERLEANDTLTVDSDVFNLSLQPSDRLTDTTMESRSNANLLYVHRIKLPEGRYRLTASAIDSVSKNSRNSMAMREFELQKLESAEFAFSDIKWVAGEIPDTKRRVAGRDALIPLVSNGSFINEDSMIFYQEIYNADQILDDNYIIRSVIFQGENRLYNTETRGQPRPPRSVNAYKEHIPISDLGSNTYYLQVELVNGRNKIVRTYRQKFYVYNARKDAAFDLALAANNRETDIFNEYTEEELEYYLRTFTYLATTQEVQFMRSLDSYEQKKNFLYSFLVKRKQTPEQQVTAIWRGHLAALKYVNEHFESTLGDGWTTDRGRIFLKYGIPNDIERYPAESATIPYEIWRYNRLGAQTNVIFVFYDPDLATGEYPLLHSTKYGEIQDQRWRSQLSGPQKGLPGGEIDYERDNNVFGRDPKLQLNTRED
ncbi:MAG: GWxTD domain-containing protein [Bacteroidota bacterium]